MEVMTGELGSIEAWCCSRYLPLGGSMIVSGALLPVSPLTAHSNTSLRRPDFPPAPSPPYPYAIHRACWRTVRQVELEGWMGSYGARVCGEGERSVGGHESFSELCLVDFVERTWLSLRLLDISTNDKEMWVRPAVYTSYFSPPQLTRASHYCNSNVSMTLIWSCRVLDDPVLLLLYQ